MPFTGISGKYWDVLLGRGLLLPAFEEGLVSARQGEETKFSFVFPDDYFQEELRGKEVEVYAKVHKVFRSLHATSLEEVRNLEYPQYLSFLRLGPVERAKRHTVLSGPA